MVFTFYSDEMADVIGYDDYNGYYHLMILYVKLSNSRSYIDTLSSLPLPLSLLCSQFSLIISRRRGRAVLISAYAYYRDAFSARPTSTRNLFSPPL